MLSLQLPVVTGVDQTLHAGLDRLSCKQSRDQPRHLRRPLVQSIDAQHAVQMPYAIRTLVNVAMAHPNRLYDISLI